MVRRMAIVGMCALALILAAIAAPKSSMPKAEALCIDIPPIPVVLPNGATVCI